MRRAADNLLKSSDNFYYKEGLYYSALADVQQESITNIDSIQKKIIDNLDIFTPINRENRKAHKLLGLMYFYQSNYSEAADLYWNLLQYNPKDDVARHNYEVAMFFKKYSDNNTQAESSSQILQEDKENIPFSLFKLDINDMYYLPTLKDSTNEEVGY